jgi:hypothetical protein
VKKNQFRDGQRVWVKARIIKAGRSGTCHVQIDGGTGAYVQSEDMRLRKVRGQPGKKITVAMLANRMKDDWR